MLYLKPNDRWSAGFIPGYSKREPVINGLGELRPDVVIGSGNAAYQAIHSDNRPHCVEQVIANLHP